MGGLSLYCQDPLRGPPRVMVKESGLCEARKAACSLAWDLVLPLNIQLENPAVDPGTRGLAGWGCQKGTAYCHAGCCLVSQLPAQENARGH